MSGLRLIQHCAEFLSKSKASQVPKGIRGIYVLLNQRGTTKKLDVVYIGMSRTGVRSRLKEHESSKKKADLWTHFSVYSVWPNVTDDEISELEGMFRAIYRKDSRANRIAVQKGFKKLRDVRNDKFNWD
jgi:hypothetical protein